MLVAARCRSRTGRAVFLAFLCQLPIVPAGAQTIPAAQPDVRLLQPGVATLTARVDATRALPQFAEVIAQAFGEQDNITALALPLTPLEVAHA